MELRNQIHQNAVAIIIDANPTLVAEVEKASEAELCGMSRAEYLDVRVRQALERQARLQRMLPWEYQLRLAERSGIDVSGVREEDRRAEAAALGLDSSL